jgi:hypothetical protein
MTTTKRGATNATKNIPSVLVAIPRATADRILRQGERLPPDDPFVESNARWFVPDGTSDAQSSTLATIEAEQTRAITEQEQADPSEMLKDMVIFTTTGLTMTWPPAREGFVGTSSTRPTRSSPSTASCFAPVV